MIVGYLFIISDVISRQPLTTLVYSDTLSLLHFAHSFDGISFSVCVHTHFVPITYHPV